MNARPPIRLVEARAEGVLSAADDDDLMLLARADRQDAFELLVRRHQALVFGVAARFLNDRTLGRDVMQDVFLALWRERERYKSQGRFRSYLLAMTLNRCHMVARGRQSQERRAGSAARAQEDARPAVHLPVDALVERERTRELRQLLAQVPEHQREILLLRFAEELELDEIARATGHPLGTVKSHLFRGLKTLRALLQKESP